MFDGNSSGQDFMQKTGHVPERDEIEIQIL